ncbi:DUF6086 family protein [Micromonospora sp. NPDC048909]|uniref:DUF6086 family protein n=1 Tax=Micromonospora sp. NPDC048909 TaxID=3155643 RepID=UPI0033F063C9
MSQYFQVGPQVLWNPSNNVAELFVRTGDALSPLVGLPTGVGPNVNDDYEIDLDAFGAFVSALADRYRSSTHLILRSLIEGHLVTAIVMLGRAGRAVPDLDGAAAPHPRDVSVGPDGFGRQAEPGRLRALVAEHARSMPC